MKVLTFMLLTIFSIPGKINAQTLSGRWRSSDSTRIYHVYQKDAVMEAVLENSTRTTDKSGALVLSLVEKKSSRRYRGIIHSVDGEMVTVATIKFKGNDILKLRLRRFLIPVKIKWYKVKERKIAGHKDLFKT